MAPDYISPVYNLARSQPPGGQADGKPWWSSGAGPQDAPDSVFSCNRPPAGAGFACRELFI